LDDSNIGLSEIQSVGPGKAFVTAPTTLKKYKNGYYVSPIFPRWNMEKWIEAGQPHVQKKLSEYAVEFLKDLSAPEDHEELMRMGEEFIERLNAG
jgi:trimethylamine:corrinoid methyltransferase-like protein